MSDETSKAGYYDDEDVLAVEDSSFKTGLIAGFATGVSASIIGVIGYHWLVIVGVLP